MILETVIERLMTVRREVGDILYRQAVKKVNLMKIDQDREKRKSFPWTMYETAFERQAGICPECGEGMVLQKGKLHMDHINPFRKVGFNDENNLRVTHPKCNLKKSSKSFLRQSKLTGRTFTTMLKPQQ